MENRYRFRRSDGWNLLKTVDQGLQFQTLGIRTETSGEFVTATPRVLRNFINGAYVDAETDATSDIVNPVTAQVVAKAPVSTAADVDKAYAAADAAFEEWGQTTPSERQKALLDFADAIEEHADDFVRLEAENTGKPHALTASEEVPPMVDQVGFFAGARLACSRAGRR